MGTCSKFNHVKPLPACKVDRGGQASNVLADGIFSMTTNACFNRCGERQIEAISNLLKGVMDSQGELSARSIILTADRRYDLPAFVASGERFGISSVFIMPSHLLGVHPFVGASHLHIRSCQRTGGVCRECRPCVSRRPPTHWIFRNPWRGGRKKAPMTPDDD